MKIVSLKFAVVGVAILTSSCGNPLDVLGPRDKPKIVSEQWNQIEIIYWVFFSEKPEQEITRKLTMDPSVVERLKSERI